MTSSTIVALLVLGVTRPMPGVAQPEAPMPSEASPPPAAGPAPAFAFEPIPAFSAQREAQREATFLLGEGDRLNRSGQREAAREKWLAAAAAYRRADNGLGEADAYGRLAASYFPESLFDAKKNELAFDYYTRMLMTGSRVYETSIQKDLSFDPDLLKQAEDLFQQGHRLFAAGDCSSAQPLLAKARGLYRQAGFGAGEVRSLIFRARCQSRARDHLGALSTVLEAIPIAGNLPQGTATSEMYLQAGELLQQGKWQEAQAAYEEVIRRYQESKDLSEVAQVTNDLGVLHAGLGRSAEAEACFLRALETLRSVNDEYRQHNEAVAHHNLGGLYANTGRLQAGIEHLRTALGLWQGLGEPKNEVATLTGLGFALREQGNHAYALRILDQAWTLQQRLSPNPEMEGDLLNNFALVHLSQGRFQDALDLLQKAVALYREAVRPQKEAQALTNIGSVEFLSGRFGEAIKTYEEVLELGKRLGVTALEAKARLNIAGIYLQRGEYQKAMQIYLATLPDLAASGDLATESSIRVNLSSIYLRLGDLPSAQAQLVRALETSRQMGLPEVTANILLNLGFLLIQAGAEAAGEQRLEESLRLWRSLDNPAAVSRVLGNLALLDAAHGNVQGALDRAREALRLSDQAGSRTNQPLLLFLLGGLHLQREEFPKALEYLHRSIAIAAEVGDPAAACVSELLIAFTHFVRGDRALAARHLDASVASLDRLGGAVTLSELKGPLMSQLFGGYALAVALSAELGRPEGAFRYAEQARARAFLDQIGNQRVDFRHGGDPELVRQEQELRQRLSGLRESLKAEQEKTISGGRDDLVRSLHEEIEKTREEYATLLVRLKLSNPDYSSLISVSTLGLREVQGDLLPERTTLIEYFVTEPPGRRRGQGSVLAWVVDRDRFELVRLSLTAEELEKRVRLLVQLIESGAPVDSPLAELYDGLFSPLLPFIRYRDLIVVPHGVLHSLPFGALRQAGSGRYLLDDYTLRYAPSATAMKLALARPASVREQVLSLGDPDGSLPFAVTEARAVAKLFGTEPLLGRAATESAVVEQSGSVGILHLAAHGIYNPINPLFTRIELAADDRRDGDLEMHEVFGLDLAGVGLVVLSSCQSQLGNLSAGDDLAGLSRAFLYAGTSSIIASLWKVDDESTAELMERLYSHLRSGAGKAEALRRAQAETRTRFPHPRYWAAFVLTGDGEPIQQKSVSAPASSWPIAFSTGTRRDRSATATAS